MLNFRTGGRKIYSPYLIILAPLGKIPKNTTKAKAIASTHSNRNYVIISNRRH